jgi:hypothetical protein
MVQRAALKVFRMSEAVCKKWGSAGKNTKKHELPSKK